MSPRNIFILNSLGGVYAANGRIAEAREALEAALRIDGSFPWALQNYGGLLMEVGERAAAKRCFERALGTDPRHVESIASLADLAEKENRLEDALALADRALTLVPNFLAARSVMARLALRTGDAGAAEAIARDMLAQPGLRPNLRTTLTCCAARRSRSSAALRRPSTLSPKRTRWTVSCRRRASRTPDYASSPVAIASLTAFIRTADPVDVDAAAGGRPVDARIPGRVPALGHNVVAAGAGGPSRHHDTRGAGQLPRRARIVAARARCARTLEFPAGRRSSGSGGASTGIAWKGRCRLAQSERLTSTSCR